MSSIIFGGNIPDLPIRADSSPQGTEGLFWPVGNMDMFEDNYNTYDLGTAYEILKKIHAKHLREKRKDKSCKEPKKKTPVSSEISYEDISGKPEQKRPSMQPYIAPTGKPEQKRPSMQPYIAPTGKQEQPPYIAPTGKPEQKRPSMPPYIAPTGKPEQPPYIAPTGKPEQPPYIAPTGKPEVKPEQKRPIPEKEIEYVELKYLINNYNNYMNFIIDIYNRLVESYNSLEVASGCNGPVKPKVTVQKYTTYTPLTLETTYVPHYDFVDKFHQILIKNADELFVSLKKLVEVASVELTKTTCK